MLGTPVWPFSLQWESGGRKCAAPTEQQFSTGDHTAQEIIHESREKSEGARNHQVWYAGPETIEQNPGRRSGKGAREHAQAGDHRSQSGHKDNEGGEKSSFVYPSIEAISVGTNGLGLALSTSILSIRPTAKENEL